MQLRLGIEIACRAPHQASLADGEGTFIWSGRRFRTAAKELEGLWAMLPEGTDPVDELVILEPTRNAWVPLAAWFRRPGARVILVPPEQSADLRASDLANKTPLRFLASGYACPHTVKRLGRARLGRFLYRHSRESWGEEKADELHQVANDTLGLWASELVRPTYHPPGEGSARPGRDSWTATASLAARTPARLLSKSPIPPPTTGQPQRPR